MKLRKLFALLMAAVMLLTGMTNAALAYACPDGQHQWGPKDYFGYTPNCVEPGGWVQTCTKCGAERDGEDYGPHSWGSWTTVREGNCVQSGLEQRTCSVCGKTETRETGGGGHKFGAWRVSVPSTCVEKGREEQRCSVCGYTQWRPTDMIDHTFGEWYTVKMPAVQEPGLEERKCSMCGLTEERETPPLDPEVLVPIPGGSINVNPMPGDNVPGDADESEIPQMWCNIGLVNDPANGAYFVPGETAQFSIAYENPSDYDVINARIYGAVQDTGAHNAGNQLAYTMPIENAPVAAHGTGSFGLSYTVTEADAARGAIYAEAGFWADLPSGIPVYEYITVPMLAVPCGVDKEAVLPTVMLDKSVLSTPANGEFYVPGEAIEYGLFLTVYGPDQTKRTEAYTVYKPVLYDPLLGGDGLLLIPPMDYIYETGRPFTYTVTEEDAQRGYVENTGYALFSYTEGGETVRIDSNTVTVPCGPAESEEAAVLLLAKSVASLPANGKYYVPGEIVVFEIEATNYSTIDLEGLEVTDVLFDDTFLMDDFSAGKTYDITYRYAVTEVDAAAGSVSNYAWLRAIGENGYYMETSNVVSVPCGFPEGDDPFGIFHSLAVVKKEESLPLNGQYYTEGEVIHYAITYTNDGELPLTDVEVWDILDISTPIAHAETLQPGESRVCYYQHTVTAADVAAGSVMNIAHASYPVSSSAGFANSCSNVVISKTSANDFVWGTLPLFPDGTISGGTTTPGGYTPGTGWFPPDAGEETPDFGTIDTDALHGGETYCVRTITGRDNVSATYETTFCTEHADTQSSALIMAQAAATPELQMQSAAYAVSLWRSEVEKLYQEIYEASDPTAKTVVMTEYVRFLTDVANYEAMLRVLYPDQPALVAQKVATKWENKCIDLCYDAHATAAERKDSLLAVTPATGAVAADCTCEVKAQEAGKKTSVQSYCAVHSFPFSMIDALLQGNDTADAWTMVRQIWGVELTNAYNKIYTAMGENKLLAMVEYNALTQWMMAREASLIALYPENPEIVVQIMVKTIMDRVNDLCRITQ